MSREMSVEISACWCWLCRKKADAEAAAADAQRAREEKRERLDRLCNMLRDAHRKGAISLERFNFDIDSTFGFEGYRYEIREID